VDVASRAVGVPQLVKGDDLVAVTARAQDGIALKAGYFDAGRDAATEKSADKGLQAASGTGDAASDKTVSGSRLLLTAFIPLLPKLAETSSRSISICDGQHRLLPRGRKR
jgi:hypothetical protein